jgi:hypothetical protein
LPPSALRDLAAGGLIGCRNTANGRPNGANEGTMPTIVTGSIASLLAILFLGWIAVDIGSIPLSIVMLIGIGLMLADFIASVRKPENQA